MVIIAIPVMIVAFYAVRRHYRAVARRLRAKAHAVLARREIENTVVLYVERLDAATREALWYAQHDLRTARSARSTCRSPAATPGIGPALLPTGPTATRGCEVLAEEDEPLDAMLEYVWRFPHGEGRFVTVVIPELFRAPSLVSAVMRRTTFRLKLRLPARAGHRGHRCPTARSAEASSPWSRAARDCVVPVADVHAASLGAALRAVARVPRDEGRLVRVRRRRSAAIERDWRRFPTGAPARGGRGAVPRHRRPLLTYLRRITADPDAVAVVVMPELVVRGTDRLLHNQRALYLKRLLLFEPRVILTSVPFQLT